jgi:B12-binding domain/radical SAM domain protein
LKKNAVIACSSSKNWYSFAPLFASLENSSIYQMYDVFILKKRKIAEIKRIVNQYERNIFAYSFYTHEAPAINTEIKQIRDNFHQQKVILVAGGPHASGNPKQTLQMGFDLIVRGEGERIFPLLLERIGNRENYLDIPGLCYWSDNHPHISDTSPILNLDDYTTFSRRFNLYPPLEISRGCPYGCKYCEVAYLFGKTMRHRSISAILEIVKVYKEIFTIRRKTDIRFISPNSLAYGSDGRNPKPEILQQLLKSIYDLDVRIFFATFPSETRPEFITRPVLEAITPYISNNQIAFGAQSGSEKMLKLIGRQHTLEDILNAVTNILDFKLIPLVDFLLGLPGEDVNDQYQTLDLIKDLIKNKKAKIRIHYFMPLAGSPFENAKPVPIDSAILSELGRFAKKGYLQGNLNTQITNSNKTQAFFQSFTNK